MYQTVYRLFQTSSIILCMVVITLPVCGQSSNKVEPPDRSALKNEWRKEFSVDRLFKAVKYWVYQQYTLQLIIDKSPDHKERAEQLLIQMDTRYGAAIEAIDKYGQTISDNWNSLYDAIKEQTTATLAANKTNSERVITFLEEVSLQLDGGFPSEIGETILSFYPKYDLVPEMEFLDGIVQKFVSGGILYSSGLKFEITCPVSWNVEEVGEWLVLDATSKGSYGEASLVIEIVEDKRSSSTVVTNDYLDRLASPSSPLMPTVDFKNGFFIDQGSMVVSDQYCAWTHFISKREFRGTHKHDYIWSLYLFYDDRVINLQFTVLVSSKIASDLYTDREIEARFDYYEPLFKLILESFEFTDKNKLP